MLKLYGTGTCPGCREAKANLDFYGIEYEYVDILESMANLKEFLKIRDNSNLYDEVKKNNRIGIPTFKEDDTVFIDWESYLNKQGKSVIDFTSVEACGIDGKC